MLSESSLKHKSLFLNNSNECRDKEEEEEEEEGEKAVIEDDIVSLSCCYERLRLIHYNERGEKGMKTQREQIKRYFQEEIKSYQKRVREILREQREGRMISMAKVNQLAERNRVKRCEYLISACEEQEYRVEFYHVRCNANTRKRLVCQKLNIENEKHRKDLQKAIVRVTVWQKRKSIAFYSEPWEVVVVVASNVSKEKDESNYWWKKDIQQSHALWKLIHCTELIIQTTTKKHKKIEEIQCYGRCKSRGLAIILKTIRGEGEAEAEAALLVKGKKELENSSNRNNHNNSICISNTNMNHNSSLTISKEEEEEEEEKQYYIEKEQEQQEKKEQRQKQEQKQEPSSLWKRAVNPSSKLRNQITIELIYQLHDEIIKILK
jgi:hypothetical protein